MSKGGEMDYVKDKGPKTTIWRQTSSGLLLVKTVSGLPYGTAQTIQIEGLGSARQTGIQTVGSEKTINEVLYTLD